VRNSDDVPDPGILRLVAAYEQARVRWNKVAWARTAVGSTHREADALNDAARALADALMRCGPVLVDGYLYSVTSNGIMRLKRRNRANSAKESIA
jgi:hypothetical protein